jgi:hypothetical protein
LFLPGSSIMELYPFVSSPGFTVAKPCPVRYKRRKLKSVWFRAESRWLVPHSGKAVYGRSVAGLATSRFHLGVSQ